MRETFRNAVILRTSCDREPVPDKYLIMDHTAARRDELLTRMQLAASVHKADPNFIYVTFADYYPFIFGGKLDESLAEEIEAEGVVHRGYLSLPTGDFTGVEYLSLFVEEKHAHWRFATKDYYGEWMSEYLSRDSIVAFIPTSLELVDAWKETHGGVQSS